MPLDNDTLTRLIALKDQPRATARFPVPPQEGPLRWVDGKLRCASRGCSSPTHSKIDGVPYCMMHALHKLNEMVVSLQKRAFDNLKSSTGDDKERVYRSSPYCDEATDSSHSSACGLDSR